MFSRGRNHMRTVSNPAVNDEPGRDIFHADRGAARPTHMPAESPASSPLDMTFESELAPTTPSVVPPSSLRPAHYDDTRPTPGVENFSRPRTSDGPSLARRAPPSPNPYVLPPIPRVASRYERDRGPDRTPAAESATTFNSASYRGGSILGDVTNTVDARGTLQPRLSFEHPLDLLSLAPRDARGPREMESAAVRDSGDGIPRMESSLFPSKNDSGPLPTPPPADLPVMTRSFIDSRDKPYSHPAPSSLIRTNNYSTPDLLTPQPPVGTPARPKTSRLRSQHSSQSLASKATSEGLSGTTALASTQASLLGRTAPSTPVITIGTPYSETSSSFPVPERVNRRPTSANLTATVAGVSVPTHYSSSSKSEARSGGGKKKGRLLNVFQRRRAGQDGETAVEERAQRQAQAQALARQKDVVVGGVNRLPHDFDPSIKGKVVHDFSAPRNKRNTFGEIETPVASQLQSSLGTPSPPSDSFSTRSSSLPNNRSSRENSSRLGARTPIFKEHLNEDADASGRISSIHAENLENKDFLQRASMHSSSNFSQDSSMLPPFARRSQILDPAQAAFAQDSDPKHPSARPGEKEPDVVSPLTTPHEQGFVLHPRRSVSPVSFSAPTRLPGVVSPGLASPGLTSNPQQEDVRASDPLVQAHRPAPDALALPRSEYLTDSPSPMAVSPIEPLTPTKPSNVQDSSQPSPLQLTPPDYQFRQQPPVTTTAGATTTTSSTTVLTPGKKVILDQNTGFPTPDRTPEPAGRMAQTARPPSRPKVAEKRTSAGGRSKRAFSGPKHHASTASRFSFQYASGESAAEEHALEDKHRKLVKRGQISANVARGPSPDEEEEDYFDEDAMDDMDEMEMEDQDFEAQFPMPDVPAPPSQPSPSMQQARQMLRPPDSDDSDAGDADERHLPYPDHSAYRTHSAIMSPHASLSPGTPDGYWRGSTIDHYMRDSVVPQRPRNTSGASALTINTNVGPFSNSNLSRPAPPGNSTSGPRQDAHNRVISGMSFSSASDVARSPPPVRPSSGHRASRSGAAAASPSALQQINNSSSESSQIASGPTSARSTGSSHMNSTAPANRRPLERHSRHASPAMSGRSPPNGSAIPEDEATSAVSQAVDMRPAAGLGLNMLANVGYGDSPTIPLHHVALRAPVGKQKSGLGESTLSAEPQGTGGLNCPAVQSPPATVELRGTDGFDGSNRPHPVHDPRSHRTSSSANNRPQILASGYISRRSAPPKNSVSDGTASHDVDRSDAASQANDAYRGPPFKTPSVAPEGLFPMQPSNLSPGGTSAVYQGSVGRGLQVRSPNLSNQVPPQRVQQPPLESGNDDLYYDDGNFLDEDFGGMSGELIDEDAFDDDTFPTGAMSHRRDNSALTVNSMGSDGPYPSFAMPNASKARELDSQMMLEDLPLQDPVDLKLIPRRNASEDAKRLGLSKRAPPLPVAPSDSEAYSHMQANLQSYHAGLADAVNKAAADGRFTRVASTSTAKSLGGMSSKYTDEDQSEYSHDAHDDYLDTREGNNLYPGADGVDRSASHQTASTHFTQQSYSPSKMSFDFGFDQAPGDDEGDLDDEDLVAAANADVLASDYDGFYGQEFRFYGRPRSNSGEVEAMHGGYFGDDGEDGLARNRSLKEPNLTPITERSEFSTRNSFIGGLGPASAGPFGPHSPALARVPVSPWTESDITSFDQLRKLRANAFAGSSTSLASSNRSSAHSIPGFSVGNNPSGYSASPASATALRSPATGAASSRPNHVSNPAYMGDGGVDLASSPASNLPLTGQGSGPLSGSGPSMHPVGTPSSQPFFDSPLSLALAHEPFSSPLLVPPPSSPDPTDTSHLATPKRPSHSKSASSGSIGTGSPFGTIAWGEQRPETPPTAKRVSGHGNPGAGIGGAGSPTHSRKGSSNSNSGMADSVTYVREPDPDGGGKPRWVLERRRTSSQGQLELVGRELVQGGWI